MCFGEEGTGPNEDGTLDMGVSVHRAWKGRTMSWAQSGNGLEVSGQTHTSLLSGCEMMRWPAQEWTEVWQNEVPAAATAGTR